MTLETRANDTGPEATTPVETLWVAEPAALRWIRRCADQWAEGRRRAQKVQDLSGDSLRK